MTIVNEHITTESFGREIIDAAGTVCDIPQNDGFSLCELFDQITESASPHSQTFGQLEGYARDGMLANVPNGFVDFE